MNKFTGILLSACLLSGSASWGMGQAVENLVKNNPTKCCKAALLIGAPLAYGCFSYIRAFNKSAKTKELIKQVLTERKTTSDELNNYAVQLYHDLSFKEQKLKASFIGGYIRGGCASALSRLLGAKDPITIAGIGIIAAVKKTMDYACDLSYAADTAPGELQAMPQNHD